MKPGGFTILETLAVVLLIGLAAVMLTPMLIGTTDSAETDNALHTMLDMDTRARLLAMREGSALLTLHDGAWAILESEAAQKNRADADTFASWRPAASVRITLSDRGGTPIESVRYDAAGRAPDYSVLVENGASARSVRVAGLTGWTEAENPR